MVPFMAPWALFTERKNDFANNIASLKKESQDLNDTERENWLCGILKIHLGSQMTRRNHLS
jgi:hypothetical protein